jgi:hypothetical protein
MVCLPVITIGDITLKDHAIRAQKRSDEGAFSSEDFNGILGSEVLPQFEVNFDFCTIESFSRVIPATNLIPNGKEPEV